MIEVQGLAKRFAAGRGARARVVQAVDGVSFVAADSCITGLLGPNGAGKTTTMRMLAGLIEPDAGRMAVDGIDVAARPRAALARLGVLSEAKGLYPRLTARAAAAAVLDMRGLLDRRTEGFSQGERMKTALARALVHDPPNLMLDEPSNGLDVLATRALRDTLRRLRDDAGKCIVLSTHIMQEVERLADHVVLVSHGRAVAAGTVAELNRQAGCADFEDSFVQLAFGGAERVRGAGA